MTFNYFQENSTIGSDNANTNNKDKRYDIVKAHLHPYPYEAFVVTALNESTITLGGGTYRVFLGGGGGGGSSYANYYGGYGGLFWFEAFLPPGSYEVGVGAGGQNNNASGGSTANPALNSNTYVMRGGAGSVGGRTHSSGSGGGGSYLKANFTLNQANWNNYVGIVGGGGASATHSFTSNSGGHGFGVGGTAWSANYPNSTYAGKNGFDGNNGTGGTSVTSSSNLNGGSASVQNQLFGGSAFAYTSDSNSGGHNGGAGGGGAGGGSAGSGGDNNRGTQTGINGGYISTTTTVNGYTTEVVPRGGGGGGGHSNDCGGTGAGGGILLFTNYTNSWNETQGAGVPSWSNSYRQQASYNASAGFGGMAAYTAYGDLQSYTSTYFGTDLTANGEVLVQKCRKGNYLTAGGHGFAVIASKNKVVTPTYIT